MTRLKIAGAGMRIGPPWSTFSAPSQDFETLELQLQSANAATSSREFEMLPLPQTAELSDVPTEFHTTDFAGVFPQMAPGQVRACVRQRTAPKHAVVALDAGRLEAFQKMMNDEGFVLELSRLL